MAQNTDKMLQEVRFLDGSSFRGEVYQDEETQFIYKLWSQEANLISNLIHV